jgi:hypothetical protein
MHVAAEKNTGNEKVGSQGKAHCFKHQSQYPSTFLFPRVYSPAVGHIAPFHFSPTERLNCSQVKAGLSHPTLQLQIPTEFPVFSSFALGKAGYFSKVYEHTTPTTAT